MKQHFDIHLKGQILYKGLTFQIMRKADELNLFGSANYWNKYEILIRIEGETLHLDAFISWINKKIINDDIKILVEEGSINNYHQFMIGSWDIDKKLY